MAFSYGRTLQGRPHESQPSYRYPRWVHLVVRNAYRQHGVATLAVQRDALIAEHILRADDPSKAC